MKRPYTRLSWEDWLALARQYRAEHGDLLVPNLYVTPDGYRLGRWIERQRALRFPDAAISGAPLTPDRIAALDALNMVWRRESRSPWDSWLALCRAYRAEHGDLLVPHSYGTQGRALGAWLAEQRKRYAAGALAPDRIAALDALGMVWTTARRRPWADWYRDAARYYEAQGDLRVPADYLTPEGHPLGRWLHSQREKRLRTQSANPERIAALDAIGMVWSMDETRAANWERMYAAVRDYRDRTGVLPLSPRGLRAPDGRAMDDWIRAQRKALSNGTLSPEKTERLALLGIHR